MLTLPVPSDVPEVHGPPCRTTCWQFNAGTAPQVLRQVLPPPPKTTRSAFKRKNGIPKTNRKKKTSKKRGTALPNRAPDCVLTSNPIPASETAPTVISTRSTPPAKMEEGSSQQPSEPNSALHGLRLWVVIGGMMLGVYLVGLDMTIVSTVCCSEPRHWLRT